MSDIAIKFEQVSKYYKLYDSPKDRFKEALDPFRRRRYREFFALKNIDLEIKKGEILGVVGRNGSGKSTLLKLIAGVIPPSSGALTVNGNISAMLELGSGLNPDLSGIQNIYFGGIMLGISPEEMESKVDEIIAFADIGDFINQPLKTYSSGMKARLGFALAVHINPDILVIDEVLSVGDDLFRRKCYARMEDFFKGGKTILLVSHDANSINQLCTRAILLDKGECILEGPAKMVTMYYQRMLYAVKGKCEDVRKEIIELNKNEVLKHEMSQEIQQVKTLDVPLNHETIDNAATAQTLKETNKIESVENIVKVKAYFLPDFKPKSTIEYKNYDVDIFDFRITTLSGARVNVLMTGEKYIYEYSTQFNINVKNVSFGMTITNQKGIAISGLMSSKKLITMPDVYAGERYIVRWYFDCVMISGNYYTYAGIKGLVNSDEEVINRIIDAMVFKVINPEHETYVGFVSLNQNVKISKL